MIDLLSMVGESRGGPKREDTRVWNLVLWKGSPTLLN